MKKALTPRQQEVLSSVIQHITDYGWPPTRAELAKALGMASPNAAQEHLSAIEKKGYIQTSQRVSRGIKVLA